MRPLRLLRDIALAVAVAALLFALLEGALWALGLGAPPRIVVRERTFAEDAPYLVPHEESGGWITQYDDMARPETVIPPKGDDERVLIFGSSNAVSFGTGRLRFELEQIAGEKRFEVLNLGRNGYGTDRVSIIVDQALPVADPDTVVIYAGDVEFMEHTTWTEEVPEWSAAWLNAAPAFVRERRIANLIAKAFFAQPGGGPLEKPEPLRMDWRDYRGGTYATTLEKYAHLEENVRRMLAASVASGARTVICTVVYNRLAVPYSSTYPDEMSAEERRRFEALRGKALQQLPGWLEPLLPWGEGGRVRVPDWEVEDGALPSGLELPGLRPATGPFAEEDPGYPDSAQWSEKILPLFECLERVHARDFGGDDRRALRIAEGALEKALAICPDHARALFELALVKYLLDRDAAVVETMFRAAARYDRAPRKSNDAVNDVICEVAAEFPEVLLVDCDEFFARHMPDRLVGWEWMRDHAHLHQGARIVLLRGVAEAILDRWP